MQKLIEEEYGYEICQSLEDLEYLQKVIDDELIDFKDWYSLECLGVVLGRVIAKNNANIDWELLKILMEEMLYLDTRNQLCDLP